MNEFSHIENSSDVGSEINEVERLDVDFGDGDGVNDFDDIDETIEIVEIQDVTPQEDDTKQPLSEKTTDENVEDILSDFIDCDNEIGELDKSEQVYESSNLEMTDKVHEITSGYYDEAKQVAINSPDNGRYYTDHREAHVEMVANKSLEVSDALKDAIKLGGVNRESSADRVAFSINIDRMTIEGSALSHDTGMRGNGYALDDKVNGIYGVHEEDNSDFNEVRNNHSINSALNLLENRDKYKEAGYSDEQIDKMAAECMAHTKSNSGVHDLNSKAEWSDCFDRIDAAVDAYNKDHSDAKIKFDRSIFENDDNKLGELASETFVLRVGDVSRDSFAGAEAQSGEAVWIDRSTLNNHSGRDIETYDVDGRGHFIEPNTKEKINAYDLETRGAIIKIGEDTVESSKSRQVHVGEQNIVKNHTYCNDVGIITHSVNVEDGASAPYCTTEALKDHMGELATAKDIESIMKIDFNSPCDEYAKDVYEDFRDEAAKNYPNVHIVYPWDKGE